MKNDINYMANDYINQTYQRLTDINKIAYSFNDYKTKYIAVNEKRVGAGLLPITSNNLIELNSVGAVLSYNQWIINANRIVKKGNKANDIIKVPFFKDNEIKYYKTVKVFSIDLTEDILGLINYLKSIDKFNVKNVVKIVRYCRNNNIKYSGCNIDIDLIKTAITGGCLS